MPTVDDLFDRYRSAYRAGEAADPRPYLDQLSGIDRAELGALIDAFLAQDPGRPGRRTALSERISAAVAARLEIPAETWGTLLPEARHRAQLPRHAVVRRLAEALGVSDREPKVAGYYHQMETGNLTGRGVSDRVLAALATIIDVPVERLRAAGQRIAPPAAGGAAVFARSAHAPLSAPMEEVLADAAPLERDEVDELFTGGA